MIVRFDVRGRNEAELLAEADRILATFSEGRRWNVQIEASSASTNTTDSVQLWKGKVTAEHEDME